MAPIAVWNTLLHAASWLAAEVSNDDLSNGPRPPSSATVHSSGTSPYRALLFGGGPAVGYGVGSHDLSLAGHLARRLTEVTQHGIDMDVVTATDLRCRDMPQLMTDVDPDHYDMVFLSVGVQDALDFTAPEDVSNAVERILRMFTRAPGRPLPVFLIGVPPVSRVLRGEPALHRHADRRAELVNDRLRTLCESMQDVTFAPFAPDAEPVVARHRSSQTYRRWADLVIDGVVHALPALRHSAQLHVDEQGRQAALAALHIMDTPSNDYFDTVTRTAHRFFGTRGAAISFIDHDRQWFKSMSGVNIVELPRSVTICDYTINTFDGFILEDATLDPRFADSYFVVNAKLRFYAGVPIRDPHGYMVGALCIFDDKPRTFTPADMVYLRDLARLVEEQLLLAAQPRHA